MAAPAFINRAIAEVQQRTNGFTLGQRINAQVMWEAMRTNDIATELSEALAVLFNAYKTLGECEQARVAASAGDKRAREADDDKPDAKRARGNSSRDFIHNSKFAGSYGAAPSGEDPRLGWDLIDAVVKDNPALAEMLEPVPMGGHTLERVMLDMEWLAVVGGDARPYESLEYYFARGHMIGVLSYWGEQTEQHGEELYIDVVNFDETPRRIVERLEKREAQHRGPVIPINVEQFKLDKEGYTRRPSPAAVYAATDIFATRLSKRAAAHGTCCMCLEPCGGTAAHRSTCEHNLGGGSGPCGNACLCERCAKFYPSSEPLRCVYDDDILTDLFKIKTQRKLQILRPLHAAACNFMACAGHARHVMIDITNGSSYSGLATYSGAAPKLWKDTKGNPSDAYSCLPGTTNGGWPDGCFRHGIGPICQAALHACLAHRGASLLCSAKPNASGNNAGRVDLALAVAPNAAHERDPKFQSRQTAKRMTYAGWGFWGKCTMCKECIAAGPDALASLQKRKLVCFQKNHFILRCSNCGVPRRVKKGHDFIRLYEKAKREKRVITDSDSEDESS